MRKTQIKTPKRMANMLTRRPKLPNLNGPQGTCWCLILFITRRIIGTKYETVNDTVVGESMALKAVVDGMLMRLNNKVTVATRTMARIGTA